MAVCQRQVQTHMTASLSLQLTVFSETQWTTSSGSSSELTFLNNSSMPTLISGKHRSDVRPRWPWCLSPWGLHRGPWMSYFRESQMEPRHPQMPGGNLNGRVACGVLMLAWTALGTVFFRPARLDYAILCYAILCYTTLYHTLLYYPILYYDILYCTILYYTILYDDNYTESPLENATDNSLGSATRVVAWTVFKRTKTTQHDQQKEQKSNSAYKE